MSDVLNSLADIIQTHVEMHSALLDAAEQKRRAIIEGNLAQMDALLVEEEALSAAVGETERKRAHVMAKVCAELEITDKPAKLTSVIERAPKEIAERLTDLHGRLKKILDKLRHRTRQNRELLHSSVDHVQGFLKMLTEAAGSSTYDKGGKYSAGGLQILDRRA